MHLSTRVRKSQLTRTWALAFKTSQLTRTRSWARSFTHSDIAQKLSFFASFGIKKLSIEMAFISILFHVIRVCSDLDFCVFFFSTVFFIFFHKDSSARLIFIYSECCVVSRHILIYLWKGKLCSSFFFFLCVLGRDRYGIICHHMRFFSQLKSSCFARAHWCCCFIQLWLHRTLSFKFCKIFKKGSALIEWPCDCQPQPQSKFGPWQPRFDTAYTWWPAGPF